MRKFGLAIAAIAAVTVLAPARSEAKKARNTMATSTMNVKMPAASKTLKVKKGTIHVRDGIVVSGQPLQNKSSQQSSVWPDSGMLNDKLDMGKPKRPKVNFLENVLLFLTK